MVEELFTLESLLSLQGAALASWIVPNTLGYLIGNKFTKARKWVSFAIAFILAFLVALTSNIAIIGWIVAIFNGFLIFASAVGINQITAFQKKEITAINPKTGEHMKIKRKEFITKSLESKKEFLTNWF